MSLKYRLKELAADFSMTTKEISQVMEKFFEKPKSNTQVLTEDELNVIFDYITQTNQIESLEVVFAVQPAQKPKAEEKPAVKAEEKPAQKAAEKQAPKAEEKPAEPKPAKPAQPERASDIENPDAAPQLPPAPGFAAPETVGGNEGGSNSRRKRRRSSRKTATDDG